MAEELKPCPFCGGGAEVVTYIDHEHDYNTLHTVGCSNTTCFGFAHPYSKCYRLYSDRERAIKEWNTRAERTCKFIPFIEDDGSIFVENCSECDAAVLSRCEFNYCPKCGAKVIDHER